MALAKPLSGRPLYATAADDALYVPPDDVVERVERSVERQLNTLLVGDRGAGKTSLLQHLLFTARQRKRAAVSYVDASIARSAVDVVDLLREALGVPPHAGETLAGGLRAAAAATAPAVGDATRLLQRLAPLSDLDETVVLLDGLDHGGTAHTLFGRLRDELWTLPLTWVVAAETEHRGQFLTPPADAFFETVVDLRPLHSGEQVELLKRRLPEEWRAVRPLVEEEEGNPRRLLSAAREILVGQRSPDDVLRSRTAREAAAVALGRSASSMLLELESLGRPVAASDQELLQRVGVTRERASQVLNRLEREGLLESFTEPGERGRPRKLYRICEPPRRGN